jgi:hypothetical protein
MKLPAELLLAWVVAKTEQVGGGRVLSSAQEVGKAWRDM